MAHGELTVPIKSINGILIDGKKIEGALTDVGTGATGTTWGVNSAT